MPKKHRNHGNRSKLRPRSLAQVQREARPIVVSRTRRLIHDVARRLTDGWQQPFDGDMAKLGDVTARVLVVESAQNKALYQRLSHGSGEARGAECPWDTADYRESWQTSMRGKGGQEVVYLHARLCAQVLVFLCRTGFCPMRCEEIAAKVRGSRVEERVTHSPVGWPDSWRLATDIPI